MGQYIATGADIGSVLGQIGEIATTTSAVTSDPAFGEIICQARILSRIADGRDDGSACAKTVITAANRDKGIGLKGALPALRAFVWIRRHPLLASAVGLAAFSLVWGWGYGTGRRR